MVRAIFAPLFHNSRTAVRRARATASARALDRATTIIRKAKFLMGCSIVKLDHQVSLVKTIKFFVRRGNCVITNTLSTFIVARDHRTAAQEILLVKEARHAILSIHMAMWTMING